MRPTIVAFLLVLVVVLAACVGCTTAPGQTEGQLVEQDALAALSAFENALDSYLQDPTKIDSLIASAASIAPKGSTAQSLAVKVQTYAQALKDNTGTVLNVQAAVDELKAELQAPAKVDAVTPILGPPAGSP